MGETWSSPDIPNYLTPEEKTYIHSLPNWERIFGFYPGKGFTQCYKGKFIRVYKNDEQRYKVFILFPFENAARYDRIAKYVRILSERDAKIDAKQEPEKSKIDKKMIES